MRDRCKHEENCGCTYKCAEYEPISSDAVLGEVISEIEDQSSDLGEHYLTIDKDRLKDILGNYFA